jgi:hypothetical protein
MELSSTVFASVELDASTGPDCAFFEPKCLLILPNTLSKSSRISSTASSMLSITTSAACTNSPTIESDGASKCLDAKLQTLSSTSCQRVRRCNTELCE